MIIDAENSIVGRVATVAAKTAILGEEVHIVNVEKAVISGNAKGTYSELRRFREMGTPRKGPFIPRQPDRFFRRKVRGMISYKTPRGREAYARVKCYSGVPPEFKDKAVRIPEADSHKLPNLKFITVKDACMSMGGKIHE